MGLYIVTLDAYDNDGRGWYFDVAVIADSIRGAKSKATRAMTSSPGYIGAKSVDAIELDVYRTGVILVSRKEPIPVA